jgi:hypothetical protein
MQQDAISPQIFIFALEYAILEGPGEPDVYENEQVFSDSVFWR